MTEQFPDLEVSPDRVSCDAFSFKGVWRVGQEAKNLMEAATIAQSILKAGKTQMQKLDGSNRTGGRMTGELWTYDYCMYVD